MKRMLQDSPLSLWPQITAELGHLGDSPAFRRFPSACIINEDASQVDEVAEDDGRLNGQWDSDYLTSSAT